MFQRLADRLFVDQRPNLHVRFQPIADFERLGPLHKGF